ncbi:MAG: Transcription antitermination protein NusB [Steroidobacteraceae bacterium]|nr:Transcription antitermination protein NusB [Steroidobacteraceae bacterium]
MSDAPTRSRAASNRRAVARRLALQALYRWQVNAGPWQDLLLEFAAADDMPKADREYFDALVRAVAADGARWDAALVPYIDRAPSELDPVEHAVLLIGLYELSARPDVPYRVVINEGVGLARRFGATDGHKYVNAVLDRAARDLRRDEH